jgi:hypothetical protein
MRPWSEADLTAFFDKVRAEQQRPPLDGAERARAQAVAVFAGGSPRIATVLYEVLDTRDALSAAEMLDKLATS